MALSREQLESFREQGFLDLGPLFDVEELEAISKEYDRLVTFGAQTLGNEEQGVFPYRAMLNFRSPELAAFVLHPALLEVAVQVLGEDVRFYWDQGINKPPGAGSPIDWHQDNGYTRGRTQEYLTCWLALDDSDRANGGLEAIPGSHRAGLLQHEWQGVHAVIPEEPAWGGTAVPLDARAGHLLIFSSLLVHRTLGNHTADRNRRSWVVQYCRGDHHNETTGEVYDNRAWAVRGGRFMTELVSERRFDLSRDG
jgi:phytanoyl-CoA hydroxylase